MFINGPGNRNFVSDRVIPKTQKMVLDAFLINTQHYNIRIKGKVEQSREMISYLTYILVEQLLKKEPSGQLIYTYIYICVSI